MNQMKKYQVWEDSGADKYIEAENLEDASEEAKEWVAGGDYDERVLVNWYVREVDPETLEPLEEDDPKHYRSAEGEVEAGPEPAPPETDCGDEDSDHVWETPYEVVGGLRENPGVWSHGGTIMSYHSVCSVCGLHKHEVHYGFQRNPGEVDTVTYEEPDEASLAWVKDQD